MRSNVAQLKHKIDSGQTGDKVAFPDPAMAPLGTDEEAGGNPTSPELIHHTIKAETAHNRPAESLVGLKVMSISILMIILCVAIVGYFLM
jgi:hypothetical protein